jgi:hypothetical protein
MLLHSEQDWHCKYKRIILYLRLPWLRFSTLTEVFYSDWGFLPWLRFSTLTEVFPCFFLSCKTNVRAILANTGHGPHSSKLVVIVFVLSLLVLLFMGILYYSMYTFILFYVILYYSMYYFILFYVLFMCICVQTTATGCLPNCSWQIYQYRYQ